MADNRETSMLTVRYVSSTTPDWLNAPTDSLAKEILACKTAADIDAMIATVRAAAREWERPLTMRPGLMTVSEADAGNAVGYLLDLAEKWRQQLQNAPKAEAD